MHSMEKKLANIKTPHWLWIEHNQIAEINPKKPKLDEELSVSFIPMGAVAEESGRYTTDDSKKFEDVKKGYTYFSDGDILFAKITPCMENGKVALLSNLTNGVGFGSTEFHVSRLTEAVEKKFYFYFFVSKSFRKQAQANMAGSAGQLRVTTDYFSNVSVPLCPTREQQRIVTKIEELFSEIDSGVESLKTAQAKLKTARQSLLKAAFEGKLTEQWRKDNADRQESPEALLERIQAEREAHYQQQLTDWQHQLKDWEAAGKEGKKPRKPKVPKALPPLTQQELAELPELPEGWKWINLGNISEISGGITKNQKRQSLPQKNPFLRVANVYANKLELDDIHFIGTTPDEAKRAKLKKDDLLIVEGNGSPDQIGRVAKWDGSIEHCTHQNHLIRSRLASPISADFVLHFLLSATGRKAIKKVASSTSGLYTLSLAKVEKLCIPVCSKNEQMMIVDQLESRLSQLDQLERTLTASMKQAEALKQSILKRAFAGRLVPQDPDDEPASELLARIRAERESQPRAPRKLHREPTP